MRAISEIPEASLVLVGSGEKASELKEQVNALKISERVAFVGQLPDEIYPMIFHACDIFVLPSIYRSEAFGIVGLEAMAAGLPLITTELGTGTSYYNIDGKTGFVVPPMNAGALKEAISKLIHNKELCNSMSRKAQERAKFFSVSRMLERYEAIYEGE